MLSVKIEINSLSKYKLLYCSTALLQTVHKRTSHKQLKLKQLKQNKNKEENKPHNQPAARGGPRWRRQRRGGMPGRTQSRRRRRRGLWAGGVWWFWAPTFGSCSTWSNCFSPCGWFWPVWRSNTSEWTKEWRRPRRRIGRCCRNTCGKGKRLFLRSIKSFLNIRANERVISEVKIIKQRLFHQISLKK